MPQPVVRHLTLVLLLLLVTVTSVAAEDFSEYALFLDTAPRPVDCEPAVTTLPLELKRGDRICLIGNTLFERAQLFGQLPATIQAGFPEHELVIRTLAWSADEVDLMPRPENFADLEQHLGYAKADVILAAYGFNESFAGETGLPAFRNRLAAFLQRLKSKASTVSRRPGSCWSRRFPMKMSPGSRRLIATTQTSLATPQPCGRWLPSSRSVSSMPSCRWLIRSLPRVT